MSDTHNTHALRCLQESTAGSLLTSTDEAASTSGVAPASAADASMLFDNRHVDRWTWQMVMWAPLGLALAAFRMGCWILGVLVDAPWFRSRDVVAGYMRLLGFTAQWRHLDRLPTVRHVCQGFTPPNPNPNPYPC
jgi:hypothetical protein